MEGKHVRLLVDFGFELLPPALVDPRQCDHGAFVVLEGRFIPRLDGCYLAAVLLAVLGCEVPPLFQRVRCECIVNVFTVSAHSGFKVSLFNTYLRPLDMLTLCQLEFFL